MITENNAIHIRRYRLADPSGIIRLWKKCNLVKPRNDPVKGMSRNLQHSPELFFVGKVESCQICSCMAGHDGYLGWIFPDSGS